MKLSRLYEKHCNIIILFRDPEECTAELNLHPVKWIKYFTVCFHEVTAKWVAFLKFLKPKRPITVPMTILSTCLIVWSVFSFNFINERNMKYGIISKGKQKVPVRKIKQNDKLFKYKALPPYNFTFTINNENKCWTDGGNGDVRMVIFVYTCPQDSEYRQHIRNTWGNKAVLQNRLGTIILFPLGLSNDQLINRHINMENELHGDILQANFVDTYRNLSYKAIMTVQWAARYCSNIKFMLKVDYDIFVNVFALVRLLTDHYSAERRFIGCKVHWRSRVLHTGQWCGKWCVSPQEFPGSEFYPVYCWGSFYVISADLIQSLSEATSTVPVWWISDVYMTGLIPRYMQLQGKIAQHLVFTDYLEEASYFYEKLEKYPKTTLFGVVRNKNDLYRAWNILKATPRLV